MRLAIIPDNAAEFAAPVPAEPSQDPQGTSAPDPGTPATPGRFRAFLAPEGVWSGDGRRFAPDSLTWRDLPLPLMGIDVTSEQHDGALSVGRIDSITREGSELWGEGTWGTTPEANRIRRAVRAGEVRGVSVDVDNFEWQLLIPPEMQGDDGVGMLLLADGDPPPEDPPPDAPPEDRVDADGNLVIPMPEPKMEVTSGRLMGATVCPFPAFAECFIEDLDPDMELVDNALVAAATPKHKTDLATDAWDPKAQVAKLPDPMPTATADAMFAWYDDAKVDAGNLPASAGKFPHHEVDDQGTPGAANLDALNAVVDALNGADPGIPDGDRQAVYDHVAKHFDDNGQQAPPLQDAKPANNPPPFPPKASVDYCIVDGCDRRATTTRRLNADVDGRVCDRHAALTAAAPLRPPLEWFARPAFDAYTPWTITDHGQVYGHIARWDDCHISFPDQCIPPPRSATAYAYFLHGECVCDDGTRVPVGQITMETGHASHHMSAFDAISHYDNTGTAAADVMAGEDRFGIWVAGALRPHLAPEQVRASMAAGVSGDWRDIAGNLELVAVLNVNVPGFNGRSPRVSGLVASGRVESVSVPLHAPRAQTMGLDPATVRRLRALIASSVGRDPATRRAEIRRRIHPEV